MRFPRILLVGVCTRKTSSRCTPTRVLAHISSYPLPRYARSRAQVRGRKDGYVDWGILTSNGIDVVDARLAVLEGRHRACPPSAQLESCIANCNWGSETLARSE